MCGVLQLWFHDKEGEDLALILLLVREWGSVSRSNILLTGFAGFNGVIRVYKS